MLVVEWPKSRIKIHNYWKYFERFVYLPDDCEHRLGQKMFQNLLHDTLNELLSLNMFLNLNSTDFRLSDPCCDLAVCIGEQGCRKLGCGLHVTELPRTVRNTILSSSRRLVMSYEQRDILDFSWDVSFVIYHIPSSVVGSYKKSLYALSFSTATLFTAQLRLSGAKRVHIPAGECRMIPLCGWTNLHDFNNMVPSWRPC